MPKVLILDFDGVVIESNAVKTDGFAHVFARFPAYAETMMAYHYSNVSMGRYGKIDYLLNLMGRKGDAALREEIAAEYSRYVVEHMKRVPLVAGTIRFLAEITARLPVYLASVTPVEELTQTLANRDLRRWFRDVYGCPPWTKPGAIIDVLGREQMAPSDALLVGDSAGDQRAARTTGVCFVARNSSLAFDDPQPLQFVDLNEIRIYLNQTVP